MANAPVLVSIQYPNGSCTDIQVEPGTTVSQIMDHAAVRPPPGYRARLVTQASEALQPDSEACCCYGTSVLLLYQGSPSISYIRWQVPAWPPLPRPPGHHVKAKPAPALLMLLIGRNVRKNDDLGMILGGLGGLVHPI